MPEIKDQHKLSSIPLVIEGEVSQYWVTTEDGMCMLSPDIWNKQGRSLQSSLSNLDGQRVRVTIELLD
ncbi:hypothetical protein [Alicyclobacillus dauci]|uniref:Uncharacterized protein n=1 Tax=Alicyclobacillus dauci TaxID=1475485 RepID=A0ABY6Z734_9BACL|nr:hypothetical protein [Alicyclobacillus dauci]WAH38560.1 hypothetical protein NZD86_08800 [Alicyclobacillus dauci]